MNRITEKAEQAVRILAEKKIDMWLTFVRESATMPDPAIDLTVGQHATWQTAWLVCRDGETIAIAGSLDAASIEDNPAYHTVIPYVQGIRDELLTVLKRKNPRKIAINFSTDSVMADGLTHGMYLLLTRMLEGTPFAGRLVSSQEIIAALRGRKTSAEIRSIRKAIRITLDIYDQVSGFLAPGKTERDVADFILERARENGVEPAWDEDHCPAVFTGPEHAGAHYGPTQRKIEAGHVLNIDFGVKYFENSFCTRHRRLQNVVSFSKHPQRFKKFSSPEVKLSKYSEGKCALKICSCFPKQAHTTKIYQACGRYRGKNVYHRRKESEIR